MIILAVLLALIKFPLIAFLLFVGMLLLMVNYPRQFFKAVGVTIGLIFVAVVISSSEPPRQAKQPTAAQLAELNATTRTRPAEIKPQTLAFTPDHMDIMDIAVRLHFIMKASGIIAAGAEVQRCYNTSINNVDKLRLCVLFDYAAYSLHNLVMQSFAARGMNTASSQGFSASMFADQAFNTRMNNYCPKAQIPNDAQTMLMLRDAVDGVLMEYQKIHD